jgi:hypothetical protein
MAEKAAFHRPGSDSGSRKSVVPTTIPLDSKVYPLHAGADYWDAYQAVMAEAFPTALHAYLAVMAQTPRWADACLAVRNAVVRPFGLKDVGRAAAVPPASDAATLRPGERVGIFTIRSVCEREAVLEVRDTHLDVLLSVYKHDGDAARVTVSTLVFQHNWLGRLYMLPVAPLHRIIVRSTLSKATGGPRSR